MKFKVRVDAQVIYSEVIEIEASSAKEAEKKADVYLYSNVPDPEMDGWDYERTDYSVGGAYE